MKISTVTNEEISAIRSLSRSEREELKRQILQADPLGIFEPAPNRTQLPNKRFIICPNCGNGTGENHTPVDVNWQNDRWLYHCFAQSDLEGDLLNIIATEANLDLRRSDDFVRALAIGANLIGVNPTDKNYKTPAKSRVTATSSKSPINETYGTPDYNSRFSSQGQKISSKNPINETYGTPDYNSRFSSQGQKISDSWQKIAALFRDVLNFDFGSVANHDIHSTCSFFLKILQRIDDAEALGFQSDGFHFDNPQERDTAQKFLSVGAETDSWAKFYVAITHDLNSVSFNRRGVAFVLNSLLTNDDNFILRLNFFLKQTDRDDKPEDFLLPYFFRHDEAKFHLKDFFQSHDSFRGLSFETLRRLGWGFLHDYKHPKNNFVFPAIIIPNIHGGILARQIDGAHKSNVLPSGVTELFHPFDEKFLFIVEGAIDGASILQATNFQVGVVATGGTSGIKLLVEAFKERYENYNPQHDPHKPNIIVLFDHDSDEPHKDAGQKAAKTLVPQLAALGFNVVNRVISDTPKRDPNTILVEDGENALQSAISEIIAGFDDDRKKQDVQAVKETVINNQIAQWQRHNGNINPNLLSELTDAVAFLRDLTADKFSAELAHDLKTIRAVALALTYGFTADAEKFFTVLKTAKAVARNRIKESKSGLTQKLSDTELAELNAVVEGINTKNLRRIIEREVNSMTKDHKAFHLAQTQKINREQAELERAAETEKTLDLRARLEELRQAPQSKERDAELIELIRQACQWKRDKLGNPVAVKDTAANLDTIFTYDPNLDGLVGFDEFQQADVFLRKPTWKKKKIIAFMKSGRTRTTLK